MSPIMYIERTRTSWAVKHNIIIDAREHEMMKNVSFRLFISLKTQSFRMNYYVPYYAVQTRRYFT